MNEDRRAYDQEIKTKVALLNQEIKQILDKIDINEKEAKSNYLDLKLQIKELREHLDHIVNGNGSPGIKQRIQDAQTIVKTQKDRLDNHIKINNWLLGIIFSMQLGILYKLFL